MKIVLVDDNIHFREDLKYFLENKLMHTVIGEAGSIDEFLSIENLKEADIFIMEISQEIRHGLEATEKILMQFPGLKIIATSLDCENAILLKLQESGFKGYINKTEIFTGLDTVLNLVYNGEFLFPDKTKYFLPVKNDDTIEERPCSEPLEV